MPKFLRYLADKFKIPKFSKKKKKKDDLFLFNQVIYLSSPVSWTTLKSLAQIVFEISCWQILKSPNFQRAITLEKGDFLIQLGNRLIIPYQLTKFRVPSSNIFRDIGWKDFIQNAQIFKGP